MGEEILRLIYYAMGIAVLIIKLTFIVFVISAFVDGIVSILREMREKYKK